MNSNMSLSRALVIFLLILATFSLGISEDISPGLIIVKFNQNYRDQINVETVDGIAKTSIPAVDNLNTKWQVSRVVKMIPDPNPNELAKALGIDLLYTFHFPENQDIYSVIKDFEKSGVFEYAEPSFIRKADMVPNDPLFISQWHLPKIQCPSAWDMIHGDSLVKVLIIDQGTDYVHNDLRYVYAINTPEDINNNRQFDPYSSSQGGDLDNIDQDQNGRVDDVIGYDFYSNYPQGDPDPYPNPGDDHGTLCAGVPVAHTNNSVGVAGISWGCRYVDARCGAGGGLYDYAYIPAITYGANRGVWAINMSFGGPGYSSAVQNVINYAWAMGCVLVASAGNTYSYGAPRYPACYNYVISCAASDQQDYRSDWGGGYQSNFATWVDVSAPGTSILTTDLGNGYEAPDGTSFSAPCVAGLAVILKSMYPTMTNAECTTRIFLSCDSMPDPKYDSGLLGRGRINVAKAIYQPIRSNLRTTSFRLNDGNNNYPQPSEAVALITTMTNERNYQNATSVSATLTCSDPDITITKNTATFPTINAGGSQSCSADSFVFTVAANAIPHRVRFIINKYASPPSFHTTDTIYVNICFPRILLVDDDAGADYERWYKQAIDSLKTFYRVWSVATDGSPTLDTLLNYPVVVWWTGLDSLNTLTATDQTNLIGYLNQGRNLFLCGQNLGQNIGTTTFYSDYLHASYVTTSTGMIYCVGVPGDPIGGVNGDTIVLGGAGGASNATSLDGIRPTGGAYGCFRYRNYPDTTVYGAIRYAGSYKVVYFGLPFEAIDYTPTRYVQKWEIMRRILTFFGEPLPGAIEQEQPMVFNTYTRPTLKIFPNPFSSSTRINLSLANPEQAEINIYNATGALVKTFSPRYSLLTTHYNFTWDGTDQNGKKLMNGVYFFELKTANGNITHKAVILR